MLYCCFSEGNLLPLHLSNNKDDKEMKTKIILGIFLLLALCVRANDGSYFFSGNQLVPIGNTNVRIDKEILTIRLADDDYAYVDVDYTFFNLQEAQTVKMGFEAVNEDTGDAGFFGMDDKHLGHPSVYDFTVEVNGKVQSYKNLMAYDLNEDKGQKPPRLDYVNFPASPELEPYIERNGEKIPVGVDCDSVSGYRTKAYVYYFEAHFESGINKVHHTYRYRMAHGIFMSYIFRYWLTPAMRWAGGKIGDFTLRISTEGKPRHFCIDTYGCLNGKVFKVVNGVGKVRDAWGYDKSGIQCELVSDSVVETVIRDGVLEMNCKNFKPTDDLWLYSADALIGADKRLKYRGLADYYERERSLVISLEKQSARERNDEWEKKVMRSLPYANRGYIFEDKKLQEFFETKWWYMPDSSYVPSTDGFTTYELELIKIGLEK